MKRKLIAIMFAVNIFIGLLPPMHAEAASIKYIERFEDQSQVEKDVPSETRIYNGQNSLSSGWYVVDKDVMLEDRLEIDGDVKLVIVDNVTLNIIKGIRVAAGNTLTIYGQKNDSGKIIAHGNSYNAGIGSNDEDDGDETAAGTVIIHGGTITARGGTDAAGIGGGNESDGGTLIIYGGNIEAKGGRYAAGIGGGDEGNSGTITIHGGTIKATAGEEAAGIGGGSTGNANRITIKAIAVLSP